MIFNSEFKGKYNNIQKIKIPGNITKNRWYKINKLFDEKGRKQIFTKDNQFNEIIEFYKKPYENNPKRNILTHNNLKQKICDIIDIVDMHTNENEICILLPKSYQKTITDSPKKQLKQQSEEIHER